MKLSFCDIKRQTFLLRECVNIPYAAYYSSNRWAFARRIIAVFYGLSLCMQIFIFLPFLKQLRAIRLHDECFNFICTGHYVDQDFVKFLDDENDELKSLIRVHRIDNDTKTDCRRSELAQYISVIFSVLGTWLNLLSSSIKGSHNFYKNYLVLKHFRRDFLPELMRQRHFEKIGHPKNPTLLIFADEGNPRIQVFLRLNVVQEFNFSKMIHIQHGLVSEKTLEWNHSIADTFFVISQKTKEYLDALYSGSRAVLLTGPYVRKSVDAVVAEGRVSDQDNGLILLQPYVQSFGTAKEYLDLWQKVADFCGAHPNKKWIVRMHPVQNFTNKLNKIFSLKNCVMDNTTSLETQIHISDFTIGISSQTSYEVISSGKPLLLIRHGNMRIAKEFEQEFALHLCDVNFLRDKYTTIDLEREFAKSEITRSKKDLAIAPFTNEEVRQNFVQCLKKVKQNDET